MASEGGIVGIVVAIIIVAFGAALAVLMVANTTTVFNNIVPSTATAAKNAFGNTTTPIYAAIPMLSLVILALIGGAIIGSLFYYLRGR